jgi:hypothetical protein
MTTFVFVQCDKVSRYSLPANFLAQCQTKPEADGLGLVISAQALVGRLIKLPPAPPNVARLAGGSPLVVYLEVSMARQLGASYRPKAWAEDGN